MLTTFIQRLSRHKVNYSDVVLKSFYHTQKRNWKRFQYCAGIVAISTVCGTIFYFELQYLHHKLKTITNVFDKEKDDSKYIYLEQDEQDFIDDLLVNKDLLRNIKEFVTEKKAKYIPFLATEENVLKALLKLTQSSSQGLRHAAVRILAKQHDWEDHQYRTIAQALDGRTQLGLARSKDVDLRFFLPMLKPPDSMVSLGDHFKSLLSSLKNEDLDKCLKHFTTKALKVESLDNEKDILFNFGSTDIEIPKAAIPVVPEERVEIICLQALASHSVDMKQCEVIKKMGGIQLLQNTYYRRTNNIVIKRLIAKILGNIAVYSCFHQEIVRAGWSTVLANWIFSQDLTLSLHAARTLANLDRDFVSCVYEDGVYLGHPVFRKRKLPKADIVFVHGLLGGPFKTWRQQDRSNPGKMQYEDIMEDVRKGTYTFCWPKDWLAKDCGNIRILFLEYDTDLTRWNASCPFETEKRSIEVRASSLLEKLEKADLGSRPIIWVGHSMGGLIIKHILSMADNSPKLQHLVNNTVGVIFYSTPHRGSALAQLSNQARFVMAPTLEVKQMGRDSPSLRRLHVEFQQMAKHYGFHCLSFGETEKSSLGTAKIKTLIIPPESSDPGIGKFYPVKSNHLNVCKPCEKDSEIYQESLRFIQHCIGQGKHQNWEDF